MLTFREFVEGEELTERRGGDSSMKNRETYNDILKVIYGIKRRWRTKRVLPREDVMFLVRLVTGQEVRRDEI
jgi:hypothetical protein